jgi:hypothetical protein
MSRVVAQKLTDANKWTIARAAPDGYTLVMGSMRKTCRTTR